VPRLPEGLCQWQKTSRYDGRKKWPCRRVEPGHYARRLDAVKPAISHRSSHDRAILLLDEAWSFFL
jgi:hypothetical protein